MTSLTPWRSNQAIIIIYRPSFHTMPLGSPLSPVTSGDSRGPSLLPGKFARDFFLKKLPSTLTASRTRAGQLVIPKMSLAIDLRDRVNSGTARIPKSDGGPRESQKDLLLLQLREGEKEIRNAVSHVINR